MLPPVVIEDISAALLLWKVMFLRDQPVLDVRRRVHDKGLEDQFDYVLSHPFMRRP
jgi:hypothetical protein